jgi:hypothetical protein
LPFWTWLLGLEIEQLACMAGRRFLFYWHRSPYIHFCFLIRDFLPNDESCSSCDVDLLFCNKRIEDSILKPLFYKCLITCLVQLYYELIFKKNKIW